MRKKTLIAALLSLSAAAVSLNLFSQGTSIVTPAGSNPTITAGFSKAGQDAAETITLNPVEDAYITQTTSDNYGSANELMVKMAYKEEHAATRITYLKFDFRSENLDSSDINNAKLRLFCTVNNVAAPVINVHGASDDNWTESDINGTNEPSRGIVLSSTTITAAGQYFEWDVSSFVASEANGDDIVSLVVFKSGNESNVNFASRESATNRPELLITKSGSGETGDHTITASAGPNGTITPNGVVAVAEGLDQVFIITPDPGYSIEDVVVDGASEGAVASYTFTNVTTDQTIAAGFVPGGQYYTITATAGLNGSISPEGAISVNEASDQTFSIMADAGYEIADVLIDGISAGPLTTYTFFFVTADHTVEAIFTPHSDTGSSQL